MRHTLLLNQDFQHDEFLTPLKSKLRNMYPQTEGWKLFNRYNWATRIFDFVLQRENDNTVQRIVVEVIFENHVSKKHIDNLNTLSKRLTSKGCNFIKKVIIVEDAATIEKLPQDIEIIFLGSLLNGSLQYSKLNPKLVA